MTKPLRTDVAAIFDWDGVIIDSHDAHERAWEQLAAELGQSLPTGFFERSFGLRNDRIIPEFTGWARADDVDAIRSLGERKEELYRELVRADGIDALPGVRELLAVLRERGVGCAIGSSTPRRNLDTVLELLGLAEGFDAIVAAEDVARGKPDPSVFLACAERLGAPADRCLVFEDAHAGIEAAQRAGMRAVAVTTTHPAETFTAADLVVSDLADPAILQLLEAVANG